MGTVDYTEIAFFRPPGCAVFYLGRKIHIGTAGKCRCSELGAAAAAEGDPDDCVGQSAGNLHRGYGKGAENPFHKPARVKTFTKISDPSNSRAGECGVS